MQPKRCLNIEVFFPAVLDKNGSIQSTSGMGVNVCLTDLHPWSRGGWSRKSCDVQPLLHRSLVGRTDLRVHVFWNYRVLSAIRRFSSTAGVLGVFFGLHLMFLCDGDRHVELQQVAVDPVIWNLEWVTGPHHVNAQIKIYSFFFFFFLQKVGSGLIRLAVFWNGQDSEFNSAPIKHTEGSKPFLKNVI